ncbi:MAG: DUF2085 domain-containing protein [Synergistaceae bacterium]|nr:DUF2085 domain-containing protein [Synergistaceae bacterium]
MKNLWERILIRLFVDNILLDKYWHCHQMGKRSFFVSGRQFHLCARCTGILVGYCLSPLLWLLIGQKIIIFFLVFLLTMAVDGFTQLAGWRESFNLLRFVTGLGFGLGFLPFCILSLVQVFSFFIIF